MNIKPLFRISLILTVAFLATLMVTGIACAQEPDWQDHYPVSNTITATLNTTVSITYDQPMSSTTVTSHTFAVHGIQSGLVTETHGLIDGHTLIVTPTHGFWPGELVQVSATTATLNITGTGPLSPTVWQFRTKVAVEQGGKFSDTVQSLGNAKSNNVMLGDLDADGDLDAFVGNGSANTVWFNDDSGAFTDSGQALGSASSTVALGDLDGDGDLDAFDAVFGAVDTVWLNNGSGVFANKSQSLPSINCSAVALGDVDGDGDLDAVVSDYNGSNDKVWLNDGAANFSDSGQNLPNTAQTAGIALADTDGDGDLDAVIGYRSGANKLWLNDGAGIFTDSGQNLANTSSWGIAMGDVNGDGSVDIFFGHEIGGNQVWLNDGAGTFTNSGQSLGSSATQSGVHLGDLDGDGDLDAFVGNIYGQPDKMWLNDGTGTFTDSGQSLDNKSSLGADLGDLDGDGDLDAFIANAKYEFVFVAEPNTVWLNQTPFKVTAVSPEPNSHTATLNTTVTATYNQPMSATTVTSRTFAVHGMQSGLVTETHGVIDGDTLIVTPTNGFHPGELVYAIATTATLNVTGTAPLSPTVWQFRTEAGVGPVVFDEVSGDFGTGSDQTYSVAWGDVDGDGDLDLAVGNIGQQNVVYLNDGDGTFDTTSYNFGPGSDGTRSVALGDVDGDGDLDLAVGNAGQQNVVYLNDGD
ncbi:MAG: hypothetical protein GY832_27590, partial [Chloroflexi bacterium]|nr:hypothetical protein [Chloroflexota bacterium]